MKTTAGIRLSVALIFSVIVIVVSQNDFVQSKWVAIRHWPVRYVNEQGHALNTQNPDGCKAAGGIPIGLDFPGGKFFVTCIGATGSGVLADSGDNK